MALLKIFRTKLSVDCFLNFEKLQNVLVLQELNPYYTVYNIDSLPLLPNRIKYYTSTAVVGKRDVANVCAGAIS